MIISYICKLKNLIEEKYMKILIVVLILLLGLLVVFYRYHKRLKEKAKFCAKEAKRFHEELKVLSSPDRLFTDEEVHKMKMKYGPLLAMVNDLYDSRTN